MSVHNTSSAKDQLQRLRSGHPWREVFDLALRVEDGERPLGWDDASLILIYTQCLFCGLTYHSAPEDFLEACKRLSRLLFRYGRAREANNYLLLLRDLSPDTEKIPTWVWSYSAKLAYLEDIEYCIEKPAAVLDYLKRVLTSDPSNTQAIAVLVDFINIASRHMTDRSTPKAAKQFLNALREFYNDFPVSFSESSKHALQRLDSFPDFVVTEELIVLPPALQPEISEKEEVQALRDELKKTRLLADRFKHENEALQKQNKNLLQELDEAIDQAQRDANKVVQLTTIVAELEMQLESLRSEAKLPQATEAVRHKISSETDSFPTLSTRARILVVGDSYISEQHLLGICKKMGLEKNQIDLKLGYKAFNSLDIGSLQYNNSVAGILVGPVPHKVPGQDDPVQALMNKEGFPPTIRVETLGGELKITKSSFRDALQNLLTRIASLEPSIQ